MKKLEKYNFEEIKIIQNKVTELMDILNERQNEKREKIQKML